MNIKIIDNICVISAKLYAASDQKSGRQWIDQSTTTTTRQRTQFVQHFSATDKIAHVQHPPYSPGLATCNFV
jgi:hypothetical protein